MTTLLRLPGPLLEQVIAEARRCGRGRNECVLYVTAPLDNPRQADSYIHPTHEASAVSTSVDTEEIGRVWDSLRRSARTIVMQVHTHPGGAFHSHRDDSLPIVHSVGFLSLVLADLGDSGLAGAHVAVYLGAGEWETIERSRWRKHLLIDD